MARIVWSRRSTADLHRLRMFLVGKSPRAANRAVATIEQGVAQLALFPAAGRPTESEHQGVRDWLIQFGSGGYVVRYRIDEDEILIMRIRHMLEDHF